MTQPIAQVRRLAVLAVLLSTTLTAAGGLRTSGATTPPPSAVSVALRSAVAYAESAGMHAGAAVLDLRTGRTWTAGASNRRYASASVVKTMIATRLLGSGHCRARTASGPGT